MQEQVIIAAGGHATRLRTFMDDQGYPSNYPKHLLPISPGASETFLGRIVRQALPITGADHITIQANSDNIGHITSHTDIPSGLHYDTSSFNHSLDMFFGRLLTTDQRVIGCAGDYYTEDDLTTLISHHESHDFPITVLAGFSVAADGGAAYTVGDNKIVAMHRVDRTEPEKPLNIGAYIFEPDTIVKRIVKTHRPSRAQAPSDDRMFEAFIRHGMLGAYVTQLPTFNVNTPEIYKAVLQHNQLAVA